MSIKAASGALLLAQHEAPAIERLWQQRLDTIDIARRLNLKEHAVCTVLARLQDERRSSRKGGAA